ncbi:transcriptional regulator, LysR family protein [alpha proteobacterium BAL199]|nr:transcriptional regulator, LysR family protein [alpha proteobacterium BAL199]
MPDRYSSINWDDLRFFLAIYRSGTLRGAARELGVNHATVTRRLSTLEAALGARVFDRRPDGLAPSQAGEDLLEAAERVEGELVAMHRRIVGRDDSPRGVVRLSVPPAMLQSFLARELVAFARLHPGIELDVDASHSYSDLARREAEVAVRMADEVTEDLVGLRVIRYRKAIYASPAYVATADGGKNLDPDVHSWIGWGAGLPYPSWPRDTPFPNLPVRHRLFSNILQLQAATEGLGLALLPCFLGDEQPGVVRVPGTGTLDGKSIWVLYHHDLRKTARIRTLIDFIAPAILRHRRLIEGGSVPTSEVSASTKN